RAVVDTVPVVHEVCLAMARGVLSAGMSSEQEVRVAYFSMELGLESGIPTYAGGLGVLAGDTLRAAADRSLPLVGVSLLHRKGHFCQRLDASGWQSEAEVAWQPEAHAE